ncbi:MAG: D-alanyl-D-alanine carboxypeptidase [Clostridia bacterium]|nr:D-alanyl-D-alanine carboxypeptidase [Clostridia bacterium]
MSRFVRVLALALALILLLPLSSALAKPLEDSCPLTLTAPSVFLLEAGTGTVIFEKNGLEKRPAASITKLMTLLLAFEALEQGTITLDTPVTVSQNAARQAGSQAFLDAGATYRMEDLLKATIIASANDAAVAIAEHLSGTENAFAEKMNEKAQVLSLRNTHYVNCTGLPAENQYTCAADVAAIAHALCAYPQYFKYSSIWMDTLTHPSGRVTDLTNTNRLVRFYDGCDGFKTGSTNEAKYCLCATAEKSGMRLIAVVLGVPNSQTRFDEARAMLDWGFASYTREEICRPGDLIGTRIPVKLGSREEVDAALGSGLSMLLKTGQKKGLSFEAELPDSLSAPVKKGQEIGTVRILLDGAVIATLPAVAADDIPLPSMLDGITRLLENWK